MEATNPSGKTVIFDPDNHSFTIKETGQVLNGATTFIKGYFLEFDADKWAPRTAKKRKTTTEAILAEWAEKAERGRNEGTNVHEYAEIMMLRKFRPNEPTNPLPQPLSGRCEDLFMVVDKAIDWLAKYYDLVDVEKIVFSPRLKISGIIDLLMRNEDGLCILDWKQNRKIKNSNPFQNALGPLNHLEDHDLNKYTLQLNVYRRILMEERYYPDIDYIDMKLIHLTQEGYFPMNLREMDLEISAMFKQYDGLFPGFMTS